MATPTTLPAAFVSGNVLTAAQMNDLRGAFRILQVVTATTSTPVSSSVGTFADTGLTATITPTSTTSKILVFANHAGCAKGGGNANNTLNLKLFRGATEVVFNNSIGANNSTVEMIFSTSILYMDSPATTSATTYKTQFANFGSAASCTVQRADTPSTIVLLEVSA
jgi:hypothetical protein